LTRLADNKKYAAFGGQRSPATNMGLAAMLADEYKYQLLVRYSAAVPA